MYQIDKYKWFKKLLKWIISYLLRIFEIIKSIFSYFIGFLLNKTPYFYNNDYVFMGSWTKLTSSSYSPQIINVPPLILTSLGVNYSTTLYHHQKEIEAMKGNSTTEGRSLTLLERSIYLFKIQPFGIWNAEAGISYHEKRKGINSKLLHNKKED